jgi:adenosylcobinamide-GDP ribazoletransferase
MKKFVHQLAAAIIFFTRIPLWKWINIPSERFSEIIYLWPLTGWITGGVTALAFWGFSILFPPMIAIILALGVRVLLTGGLHEDGLGDFMDGFGGGKSKEDILRIMKDSHIGNYALVGLIFYYLITTNTLVALPHDVIAFMIFSADSLSKTFTVVMINTLPYVRTVSQSKSKTEYKKAYLSQIIFSFIVGLSPFCIFVPYQLWISLLAPIFVVFLIRLYSLKKIGGYTGDICGATALLAELSLYIFTLLYYNVLR